MDYRNFEIHDKNTGQLSEEARLRQWDLWRSCNYAIIAIEKNHPVVESFEPNISTAIIPKQEDMYDPALEGQRLDIQRLGRKARDLAKPTLPIDEWEQERAA